jgi:hypothetical protein
MPLKRAYREAGGTPRRVGRSCAQGVIVRVALLELNGPYDAVTCAEVAWVICRVVTGNVVEVAPAGMVSCAGTLTTGLCLTPVKWFAPPGRRW